LFLDPEPSTQIVVLRAMGGQGKTQIALETCRLMREICSAVFWIDASSENSLKKDFEQIYEKIKKGGVSLVETHAKAVYVQKSLSEWPYPWLMVFDNYDDPQGFSNFQDFIPEGSFARIIITSRHADTLTLADKLGRIELPGLDKNDAIELLVKQSALQSDLNHDHVASSIVERLGYHPLAIDQAGSYIHKRRIDLQKFLIDYESRQKTILQEVPRMTQYRRKLSDNDQEIPLNVFTTCELSFQQLLANENSRSSSGQLLTFIAFFFCSPFYEWVMIAFWSNPQRDAWVPEASYFLSECLGLSDGQWDSGLFLDRLVELRDLSLIQSFHKDRAGHCSLTMHPLIQDWLILRMDHATCVRYSIWATNVLIYSTNTLNLSFDRTILQYITRNNINCKRFLQSAIKGDDVPEWAFANALFSDVLVEAELYEDAERTIEVAISAIDRTDRANTLAPILKLKRHLARTWQLQCRWEDAITLYHEISWGMGALDPRATYTAQELASCPMDAEEKFVTQMISRYEERITPGDDDSRNEMYHYDILNGLCWTLSSHGCSLEADTVMSEAFRQIKKMVTSRSLHETHLLMEEAAEETQSITDFEIESTARVDSTLHVPVPLGFFDVLGRTISHLRRAPKATAMLVEIVRRKLRGLSARRESGVAAYQLVQFLLGIRSFEQAKNIVIPKMIYQRILYGESRPEALEILSLLAEGLLRIEKFQDAKQVAEKALLGYNLRYGAKHPQTLQSQLRVARAVPLPNGNNN
jgi:NB-ARC domain